MARLGITEAFARYGATLRNPQWSVSAWAPDGSLVVSLCSHHARKGPAGTMEFADSFDRWSGPGNAEFRRNVAQAYGSKGKVRLVIVKTDDVAPVQAGENASRVKKEFLPREDLAGEVAEINGEQYVLRFRKAP